MNIPLYIAVALIFLLLIIGVTIYNNLVAKRAMVENGWSDIDVQLKRRADLIPNLVDVVKGYAAHERGVLDEVIQRRNEALSATDQSPERQALESAVSAGLSRLFALVEAYPNLKANEQFLQLQSELSDTEDKIAYARRFFNGAVRELNTAIQTFPAVLIAGPMGFQTRDFFEIEQVDRLLPEVNLKD
ncbi:MAG: hypothetical protein CMK07_02700 [Ponticaulis sp.]|nr:hypothetical protein [Ponticaulis sp.]